MNFPLIESILIGISVSGIFFGLSLASYTATNEVMQWEDPIGYKRNQRIFYMSILTIIISAFVLSVTFFIGISI